MPASTSIGIIQITDPAYRYHYTLHWILMKMIPAGDLNSTVAELSARLNVGERQIWNYRTYVEGKARGRLSEEKLAIIADAFGIDPDLLLTANVTKDQ